MKLPSKRLFAADFIRAFAIIGVLAIHLTYPIYARPDFAGGMTWWLAQSINAISRISIPLFIMLSGYLLLSKTESIKQTLSRINKRLFVPLIAWSLFYLLWNNYWFGSGMNITNLINDLLSGGFGHLYFLVIMIDLYLLLPMFRHLLQEKTKSIPLYVLIITLLFGLMYTALQYFHLEQAEINMFLLVGLPYIGYFLAGSILGKYHFSKKQIYLALLVWLGATICTAILGYWNLQLFTNGNLTFWGFVPYFDNYVSPNVMLASLAAFIVLKNASYTKISSGLFAKIVRLLAATSLGLYVLHPFVMNIIDRALDLRVDFMSESLIVYLVKRSILVLVITTGLVWLIQRIPILKKSLGE